MSKLAKCFKPKTKTINFMTEEEMTKTIMDGITKHINGNMIGFHQKSEVETIKKITIDYLMRETKKIDITKYIDVIAEQDPTNKSIIVVNPANDLTRFIMSGALQDAK